MSKLKYNTATVTNVLAVGPEGATWRPPYMMKSLAILKGEIREAWRGQPRQQINVKCWHEGQEEPYQFEMMVGSSRYGVIAKKGGKP